MLKMISKIESKFHQIEDRLQKHKRKSIHGQKKLMKIKD